MVKKKDGRNRICVDYRKLNAVTKFDAYSMLRIDEMLDAIGNAKAISTLDLGKCTGIYRWTNRIVRRLHSAAL